MCRRHLESLRSPMELLCSLPVATGRSSRAGWDRDELQSPWRVGFSSLPSRQWKIKSSLPSALSDVEMAYCVAEKAKLEVGGLSPRGKRRA